MTTAEIKSQALESIQEEMGGASTISLIKMARRLYDQGKEYDDRGDLKAALSAYVKTTSLINEADRDGSVVHKDFEDIKPVRAQLLYSAAADLGTQMFSDLLSRTELVEDKLKAMEVQTSRYMHGRCCGDPFQILIPWTGIVEGKLKATEEQASRHVSDRCFYRQAYLALEVHPLGESSRRYHPSHQPARMVSSRRWRI